MTGVIFLGPSLDYRRAAELAPGARFAPPVRCGDVLSALCTKPAFIAIIDGVFGAEASVWHKEILLALAEGVPVFGAASMGALRAAELHTEGMQGFGMVFEWYVSGKIEADDEVAVLHGPAEFGYPIFSLALVDVRHVLAGFVGAKVLAPEVASAVLQLFARRHYPRRTLDALSEDLHASGATPSARTAVVTELRTTSVKSEDAKALLMHLAKGRLARPTKRADNSLISNGVRKLIGRLASSPRSSMTLTQRTCDPRSLRSWPRLYFLTALASRALCLLGCSHSSLGARPRHSIPESATYLRLYTDVQLFQAFGVLDEIEPKHPNGQSIISGVVEKVNCLIAEALETSPITSRRPAVEPEAARILGALQSYARAYQCKTLAELMLKYERTAASAPSALRYIADVELIVMSMAYDPLWYPNLATDWWAQAVSHLRLTALLGDDTTWCDQGLAQLRKFPLNEYRLVRFGFERGMRDLMED